MKKIAATLFPKGLALISGVLLASLIFFSSFLTDSQKKYSLIFAMYDQQAAQNHIVHLRKISFVNGIPGGTENIMDIVTQEPGDKLPKIRFDLGPNQIYKNRWIITAYGQVIDMQLKKVLVSDHDKFVRASGDSIIFYTNDIFRGQFYSVLDLQSGKYNEVKSVSFRALPGKDVEPDCSLKNYKIYYYPASSEKIELVRDAGFGEDVSLIQNGKPQCPIFWIDNDNFLYPNYSSDHGFVSIMKYSMSSKTEEKVGDIDQLPENHQLSKFYKNADGDIIYSCARGQFRIDILKKKVTELLFLSAGNGFSIAINETDKKGRVIQNGSQSIGTYFCDPDYAVTAKGYIAFPYEIVLGDEHYLQGIQIYSTVAGQWKSVGDSDLSAVIGWAEE
jgi:hypothetical protein